MSTETLNEQVDVLAKFQGGRLLPMVIRWQGRRYWVQKLNLHHPQRRGSDVLHYFSVTTEAGDCVLSYSQENLSWKLTEVAFTG